ncbi:hypothetical protein QYE77_00815 [Thermanaerothrix sp. 4228-RoL]|uniref:Uncharacterized protein n=1 Tax=Thermanaerothrix solaris TaxID=3058434 RepID=A0ABU3NIV5_9CHLR|nr:hypothetical protein [Thermanaerothrix sp. 4228-RoL]MDT8896791.1 hypothetical protein [Thermanaerothrix sp. 4228-RoL]
MSDIYDRVKGDQNIFNQLLSRVPGFSGYVERAQRRVADKMLREALANRFEALWQRVSAVQRALLGEGELELVDDIEQASLKLRQFIDRLKTAAYGYTGFFDAVRIRPEDLERVYAYDLALVNLEDEVARALDHVEASIGGEGMGAAVRHLISVAQSCLDAFEKRTEVLMGISPATAESTQ